MPMKCQFAEQACLVTDLLDLSRREREDAVHDGDLAHAKLLLVVLYLIDDPAALLNLTLASLT